MDYEVTIKAFYRHDYLRQRDQETQPVYECKIKMGEEKLSWKALVFQPLLYTLGLDPDLVQGLSEKLERTCTLEDIFNYYLAQELDNSGELADVLEIVSLAARYKVAMRVPEKYEEILKDLYMLPKLSVEDKKVVRVFLKHNGVVMQQPLIEKCFSLGSGFMIPKLDEKKEQNVLPKTA